MKKGDFFVRILSFLALVGAVSARAGALASTSSGGLLHNTARDDRALAPVISDLGKLSTDALQGDVSKTLIDVSGGQEVQQVMFSNYQRNCGAPQLVSCVLCELKYRFPAVMMAI